MNIKEYLALGACNGLKVQLNNRGKFNLDEEYPRSHNEICEIQNILIDGTKHEYEISDGATTYGFIEADEFSPICFPLDQLTKSIQIKNYNGGDPFVPIEVISKRLFGMDYKNAEFSITKTHIQIDFPNTGGWKYFPINNSELWEFWIVEQLIKWHFAVGLSDDEFIPVTDEFNHYK